MAEQAAAPEQGHQAHAAAVRRALLAAGYTADGVLGRLGAAAFAALGRGERIPARHALRASPADPLHTLILMFSLGAAVPTEQAAAALPVAAAVELGIVEPTTGGTDEVRPLVVIAPYPMGEADAFVVADQPLLWACADPVPAAVAAADLVVGVGGASVTLATLTPRRAVGRTLDLGTGCGIQAVLAAAHSTSVVATDASARALLHAGRTAALSGTSFELRAGSLFEPVAEEAFDLIVANPPFVISPAARYTYRESTLRGDDLTRTVVAGAADRLAPGGIAVVLGNWLHIEGQPWTDRVAGWADQSVDSQVWAAQREVLPLPEYVELWLRDAAEHRTDPAAYEERYDEWLSYLERLGASAVGFGWVVVRRQGPRWFVAEDVADAARLPSGAEVLAQLADFDALRAADAMTLLDGSPRWSARAVRHASAPPGGRPDVVADAGWRPAAAVDPVVDALLQRPGRLADRIAAYVAQSPDGPDEDLVTVLALTGLRQLIGAGLVEVHAAP
jgi:methylase of polypeptide subunit release factors